MIIISKIISFSKRKIHYHVNYSETIYIESSQILIDPQDKLKHKIEVFHDCYMLSFDRGNLQSLLLVISALGVSFSQLMRRRSRQF